MALKSGTYRRIVINLKSVFVGFLQPSLARSPAFARIDTLARTSLISTK
jgi:hypothetical protein